uniref:protein RALF-like 4 n=1 Tax=Fragaria vesca subsp. vesca TaxID=101020 RepID=UPI0005CA7BC7
MVVDSLSTPQHYSVRTSNHGGAMSSTTAPELLDIKNIASCSKGFSGDCQNYSVENEEDGVNGFFDDFSDYSDEDIVTSQRRRTKRYISYDALLKNRVPCGQRGSSYYYCGIPGQANPYRRGCSVITRCARFN